MGLQQLVRALQDLEAVVGADAANRRQPGPRDRGRFHAERRVGEALARFAGVEVTSYVPEDRATLDRALLAGRVLAEEAPGSVVRERLGQLADALVPRSHRHCPPGGRDGCPVCHDGPVVDRLTALDVSFLTLEDRHTPMHVGQVLVFSRPLGFETSGIAGRIASRLEANPRLRQRVRWCRGGWPIRCGWTTDTSISAIASAGPPCRARVRPSS